MEEDHILLYKVEDSHSVSDWREQMSAIWTEEEVALAVHSPQEVGELEVSLHCRLQSIFGSRKRGCRKVQSSIAIKVGAFPFFPNFLAGSDVLSSFLRACYSQRGKACLYPGF